MAEVSYQDVSCRYAGSDKLAVDHLSLDVPDGGFMVLVGPSGSGKTTALRLLAGLEQISDGRIEIEGRDVSGVDSRDRDIAMVFQNYALYPNKTVAENIGFSLKMHGVSRQERDDRVLEAAKMLDIDEFLDRKPRQLSGGQRQRVAMGRAIVRRPKAFLMDEPLSNLDAKLRVQTRVQIAELQRRLETTTVYVTHDQGEAMTLGDRVAVLKDGTLQQYAPPRELYDNPVNAFVAGFIGLPQMNLIRLPLSDGSVRLGDQTIKLPRQLVQAAGENGSREIIVGIRPEHVTVDDGAGEGIPAEVVLVESLGADSYVHASIEGSESTFVARTEGYDSRQPGTNVRLRIDAERMFGFDAESEERLGDGSSAGGASQTPASS
ncbi:MAG: multiple sugar transport system ATP-binding protein [Solirubrobacteraceae bacterium]|jgi:multiple sugar transport system ATP-binding protein|nr:multiple sugar transport system ATP-binding protein [Solirubrobacteraceae bacterium]